MQLSMPSTSVSAQLFQGQEINCKLFCHQYKCSFFSFVLETCKEVAAYNSVSVFNPVNRMLRSFSGSYWTSYTQKSTADPMFDEQGRTPNKNMPDLGVYFSVEKKSILDILKPIT